MERPDLGLFLWMTAGWVPSPWLLSIAKPISQHGDWLLAFAMAALAWLRPVERPYMFALLAMAGLTSMVAHALAQGLGLQRPFALGLVPTYIPKGASGALPSAHAAVMGLIVVGLYARPIHRGWAALALGASLATVWARIYVGVHFPLDIIAGFTLSALAWFAFVGGRSMTMLVFLPAFKRIHQGAGHATRKDCTQASRAMQRSSESARHSSSTQIIK